MFHSTFMLIVFIPQQMALQCCSWAGIRSCGAKIVAKICWMQQKLSWAENSENQGLGNTFIHKINLIEIYQHAYNLVCVAGQALVAYAISRT